MNLWQIQIKKKNLVNLSPTPNGLLSRTWAIPLQMEADLLFLGEDDAKKPFAALHRHGAGQLC